MADAYQEKFDKLTALVPPATQLRQRNNISGTEIWAEVPSGTPAIPKVPAPEPSVPDYEKKKAVWAAGRAQMESGAGLHTNEDFKALTGLTHERLLNHWATHNIGALTSCNSFCGVIAGGFGHSYLNDFNLLKLLTKAGKAQFWVPASSGEKPRYGDMFESLSKNQGYDNLHIGFSLNFDEDGSWWTLEGGQGGPVLGYDRVTRNKKKWSTTHMLGWVDMRKLTGAEQVMPPWLQGTWRVTDAKSAHIYAIDRLGQVRELPFVPASGTDLSKLTPIDTATVIFSAGDMVQVKWLSERGVETLRYNRFGSVGGITERVTGSTASGEALSGVKLF